MYRDQAPRDNRPVPTTPKSDFDRQPGSSVRASGKRRFQARDNASDSAGAPSTYFAGPMYTNDDLATPPSKRRNYNGETPPPMFSPKTIQIQSTQRTSLVNRQPLRDQIKSPYSPTNRWRGSPRIFTPSRTPPARMYSSGRPLANSSARRALFTRDGPPKEEPRQFYTFTPSQLNFRDINEKPNLQLIPSITSKHYLEEPVAVVFEEQTQNWYVADRRLGLVVLNRDMTKRMFVLNTPEYDNITALVVLNGGDQIGFLCAAGICVIDTLTYAIKVLYATDFIVQGGGYLGARLRGLAITANGDFVTIDHRKYRIAFISQITGEVNWVNYMPPRGANVEGERSSPTYISVCAKQIVIVDYTLASFTIFRYNPDNPTGLSSQDIDASGSYPQCRLSAPFVDCCGRILICNKKEHVMMMYDYDGRYLNAVYVNGGFCRAQSFWVNNANQVAVIDKTTRPHCLQMYSLKADHDFKKRMAEMMKKDHEVLRNQLPLIKKHSPPSTPKPKLEPMPYPYPGAYPGYPPMLPMPGAYPHMVPQQMPYFMPPQGFPEGGMMYPPADPFLMARYPGAPQVMMNEPSSFILDDLNGAQFSPISGFEENSEDFVSASEEVVGEPLPSSPDPDGASTVSNDTSVMAYNERSDSGISEHEANAGQLSPLTADPNSLNTSIGSDTPVRNEMAMLRLN
uniref:CNH domain-containing protein n=1 Tax=Panagrellus redivivus TaxID=6233 RepID=A0A7E4VZK0_PANRE